MDKGCVIYLKNLNKKISHSASDIETTGAEERQLYKGNEIRKRLKGGFTLAELLITVAIMMILAGFAFVAVARYQKSLKLTEMDGTAKEIFIAAQNHMTAAKTSGEWDTYLEKIGADDSSSVIGGAMEKPGDFEGSDDDFADTDNHGYYYVNYSNKTGQTGMNLDSSILSTMLPFGSIDDTVRSGGSYVIEYDIKTASVYGVFYTDNSKGMSYSDVTALNANGRGDSTEAKNTRKNYKNGNSNVIIGYYGGAMAENLGNADLEVEKDSDLIIDNSDKLQVYIYDRNYFTKASLNSEGTGESGEQQVKTKITVQITGEDSKETKVIPLEQTDGVKSGVNTSSEPWWTVEKVDNELTDNKSDKALLYTLTLDDITTDKGHFADIFQDFMPGENLIIKVQYSSNDVLCNQKNIDGYTNSLYNTALTGTDGKKVTVSSIRHLQNLSPEISSVPVTGTNGTSITNWIGNVTQTQDIVWATEKKGSEITAATDENAGDSETEDETEDNTISDRKQTVVFGSDTNIYNKNNEAVDTQDGMFLSISNININSYDGAGFSIDNLKIKAVNVKKSKDNENSAGNYAGLFATAGNADVNRILTVSNVRLLNFKAEARDGAGALCGAALGNARLSASNVYVENPTIKATGNDGMAGGLSGSALGGIITDCAVYFTDDDPNLEDSMTAAQKYESGAYNSDEDSLSGTYGISALKYAGGLIGSLNTRTGDGSDSSESTTIIDCFAAVPVNTASGYAGGLVGADLGGSEIANSYAGGYTNTENYQSDSYNISAAKDAGTAGGLVALVQGSSTIKNSYSTCSVYGDNAGGLIGIENAASTYINCYTVGKVGTLDTDSKVGTFASKLNSTNIQMCYYLAGLNNGLAVVEDGSNATIEKITGKSFNQLQTADFVTSNNEANIDRKPQPVSELNVVETHNYDSAWDETAYPFPTVSDTARNAATANNVKITSDVTSVHYGDWAGVTFDAELAYYEVYRNMDTSAYSIGLYNSELNVNSLLENPAESSNVIIQDGYVTLSNIQGALDISVNNAAAQETTSITAFTQNNGSLFIRPAQTVSGSEELTWKNGGVDLEDNAFLTDDSTVEISDATYYLSFWNLLAADAISSLDNYYSKVEMNMAGSSLYFYCNPHYAKSNIQKCGDNNAQKIDLNNTGTENNPVEIRTERQYSMMTQDLLNPTNSSGTVYSKYCNLYYSQSFDLTFGNNSPYVSKYFDMASSTSVENGVGAMNPVAASANTPASNARDTVGFCGVYNGNNHKINNLTINNPSGTTTGMFGNTQGALIENVHLNNINITGTNYVGSVVGSAAHGNVSLGSKKAYTVIENITVTNAVLSGDKYVGGLTGAAYSCSTNVNNTNDFIKISGLRATGDSVIGGVFGMVQTWGKDVNGGFLYQNILITGQNSLNENTTHSTSYADAGIGGFAGEIQLSELTTASRKLNFKNIHIGSKGNLAINIANSSGSKRVYGGLFLGNLYNNGNAGTFSGSFEDCSVSNSNMNVNGATEANYSTNYSYGGLIGNINQKDKSNLTVILDGKLVMKTNCAINYKGAKNPTGKCSVGGLVGNVSASKLIIEKNEWIEPGYSDFTADSAVAYGSLVGSVSQNAEISCKRLKTLTLTAPTGITANNMGGLIGRITSGSLNMEGCSISDIRGATNVVASADTEDVNIGGVIGLVDAGVTLSGLDITNASFTCAGGTNVSVGAAIGKANAATITSSTVKDVSLKGNADNVGGFIGIASGTTLINCDVHSQSLSEGSYNVNGNGEYTNNSGVSDKAVIGQKSQSYVGGLIGSAMGATINNCFAAIPVKGTTSYIALGGLAGDANGCVISESYASGNILNHDYAGDIETADSAGNCSFSGGFTGIIEGNSSIQNCYATGIVMRGAIVGGFVGEVSGTSSVSYLNNVYSTGRVDQQQDQGNSVMHGGFMGKNCGDLRNEPLDLTQDQVGKFYELLELDLTSDQAWIDAGLGDFLDVRKTCYDAMVRRKNMGKYKTIKEYLIGNKASYNVDSTAATRGADSAQVTGSNPSVSAVVQELFNLKKYEDIRNLIKTWRLTVKSEQLYFYYSVVDIENLYTTDAVEAAVAKKTPYTIVGYQYLKKADGKCYQTKGIITLTTAKLKGSTTYGNYVQLQDYTATDPEEVIVPDQVAKETYTGCTYLREDSRGYNACNSWADSSDEYVMNVTYRDFDEFMDEDGAYLALLNKNIDDNTQADRFRITDTCTSHTYDSALNSDKYPFPAFTSATGNTSDGNTYWGDWPKVPDKISDDFGLVYYEKVDGSLYYHGYTANFASELEKDNYTEIETITKDNPDSSLENGLVTEKGKHAAEDGYLVLLPKNTDLQNVDIQLGDKEINKVNSKRLLTKVNSNNGIDADETLMKYDLYFLDLNDTTDKEKVFVESADTISVGYADNGSFGKYAEFLMTPYFADSIKCISEKHTSASEDTYVIRSVRQMGLLVQKPEFYSKSAYTFRQDLDLDYTAVDFTNRGASYSVSYLQPLAASTAGIKNNAFLSDYSVKKITDEDTEIISGYEIKGIEATLFDTIGEDAVISGVTLTDLEVSDSVGVAFAKTNNGIIESCSVRPSGNDYGSVKVSRSASTALATAGFIWTNKGTIKDSSFIGTVELSPKAPGTNDQKWGNLSGFADVNTGTIENSYTNCILNFYSKGGDTDYYTAGFCQSNREGGTIENCHAISQINYYLKGTLSSGEGKGIGFVKYNGADSSTNTTANPSKGAITNCYSVCNGMTSKESYAFNYKNLNNSTLSGNYYLKWKDGTFTNTAGASEKTYAEMKEQAKKDKAEADKDRTHAYAEELQDTAYPFSLPAEAEPYLTMQHYGDWPELKKSEAGVVYYEKIEGDNTLYYHGYKGDGTELSSDLPLATEPNTYVEEDGYLLVMPKNQSVNDIEIQFSTDEKGKASSFVDSDNPVTLSGNYVGYKFTKYYNYNAYLYNETAEPITVCADSKAIATLTMTPFFANSVQYGEVTENKYYVRSARQLSNMAGYKAYARNAGFGFVQNLDISYENADTGASTSSGFTAAIETMNADYTSMSYMDANGDNLVSYKIKGLSSWLFGSIGSEAALKGITLTNSTINANQSGTVAGFALSNDGVIESCSIRPDSADDNQNTSDEYSSVQIKNSQGNVAGFIVSNRGKVSNSYIVGSITGLSAAGFIWENQNNNAVVDHCYVNTITTSTGNEEYSDWQSIILANPENGYKTSTEYYAAGFISSNQGSIKNSHVLKSVYANTTKNHHKFLWYVQYQIGGTSYGFSKDGSGTIQNSYVAADEQKGYIIDTFGAANNTNSDRYYYNNTTRNKIQNINTTGTSRTYTQLHRDAINEDNLAVNSTTNRYRSDLPEVYPFTLSSSDSSYITMQHYGDWPVQSTEVTGRSIAETDRMAWVYYEMIEDVMYYHGYAIDQNGKDIEVGTYTTDTSTLTGLISQDGQYVTAAGYMLVLGNNSGITGNMKLYIDNNDKDMAKDGYFVEMETSIVSNCKVPIPNGMKSYELAANKYNTFKNGGTSTIRFAKTGNPSFDQTYAMTPYFADSIQVGTDSENTFYIRSKEDLINLQKTSEAEKSFAQNKDYSFIQQLDIHYQLGEFEEYIAFFDGTYHSSLYNSGLIKQSYSISGLECSPFGTIHQSARIYNVTIVNSNYASSKSNKRAMGFAKDNSGVIENCCIISKGENENYADVQIVGTDNSAGFIDNNKTKGIIRNCYVTGTVVGGTKTVDQSVAGFVKKNEGIIENCYSNCIVDNRNGSAAGFCYTNEGTIKNSHALLSVSATKDACGFVCDNSKGTISDSYAAMSNMQGETINTFGSDGTLTNCSYLSSYVADLHNLIETEDGLSYDELVNSVTSPASIQTTHAYGSEFTNQIYPFDLPVGSNGNTTPLTMQHYGDWPQNPDIQSNNISEQSLEAEVISEDKPDVHTAIAYHEDNRNDYEGWYVITDSTPDENEPYSTLNVSQNFTLGDDDTSYGILISAGVQPQVEGAQIEDTASAAVEIDGVTYDYYKLSDDELHENTAVTVTADGSDISAEYTYNDDFAASIAVTKPLGQAFENGGTPYQIRTNGQLRNMNENREVYSTCAFRQTLDITLTDDVFAPIGSVSDWTDADYLTETSTSPLYAFSGSYDAGLVVEGKTSQQSSLVTEAGQDDMATGYKIMNLKQQIWLKTIDGEGYTDEDAYLNDSNKQMFSGLFGYVTGSVRNVNLSGSIDVVRDETSSTMQAYLGTMAGRVSKTGSLTNCNSDVTLTVNADCISMYLGGMVGGNSGTVTNCYFNGVLKGAASLQNQEGYTAYTGGLAGTNTGTIDRSAASALMDIIISNHASETITGGLVGWTAKKDSLINASWSKSIIQNMDGVIGGLAGSAKDNKGTTILKNNYALNQYLNLNQTSTVGLYVGANVADASKNIFYSFAGEVDSAGVLFDSKQPFVNGISEEQMNGSCYIWNGVDNVNLNGLNQEGVWTMINGVYATLNKNPERITDVYQIGSWRLSDETGTLNSEVTETKDAANEVLMPNEITAEDETADFTENVPDNAGNSTDKQSGISEDEGLSTEAE